ncbi:MAG TPA: adenylate/guanylate cyclase domain-containing protein [Rhizomicrobium sp.]|nr:adenylate/guanylate cyclase domain-containing protein [Rhizomicrobium sp.]
MAADAVGFSLQVGHDENGTLKRLKGHLSTVFRPRVRAHKGRIIKTMGDGLLVEFTSVVEAVGCALDIQRAMLARNAELPQDQAMLFRIGIHSGDIVTDKGGDIFGEGVNIAARIETSAQPGGICISARVHEDVRGRIEADYEDIGDQTFKNIARPIRVFRVVDGPPQARERVTLVAPDIPSIAVLPLQNMSGDAEQEYFADAIAEDLITALSRWRAFFVIARNSSFVYRGQAVDVRKVGRELGVRYVIEGSVRKVENRVRMTAQLLDCTTGAHVWADKFDSDLADILELQDEITRRVAAAIEPAMARSENERISRKSFSDYTAYDCYQRGMWAFNQISAEGYAKAVALFRTAIARDPQMALGYVGLSRILYGGATIYGWSQNIDTDLLESRDAARKAIEIDPSDATAYFARAGAELYLNHHHEAVEAARKAIALNPNFAYGHVRLGQVLIYSGSPQEAIAPIEQAMRHNPFDPQQGTTLGLLALARYQSHDYEGAVRDARQAILHKFEAGYVLLAAALARLGRIEEARAAIPPDLLAKTISRTPRLASYARDEDRDHFLGGVMLAGVGLNPSS